MPDTDDNLADFARLLCEIRAMHKDLNVGRLAEVMDMDVEDVEEVFECARQVLESDGIHRVPWREHLRRLYSEAEMSGASASDVEEVVLSAIRREYDRVEIEPLPRSERERFLRYCEEN